MFCGILPWTWFSSSLTESAGVLISGGNLIKKVLFPAEILPIVTVLANMVHFFFGLADPRRLPALLPAAAAVPASWCCSRSSSLVQLVLTLGFALILSALTVHFRDIRDILSNVLTFWFFATPIIYPWFLFEDRRIRATSLAGELLKLNPFTHLAISYQEILFFAGPVGHLKWLLLLGAVSVAVVPVRLLPVRPAARYVCGGSVTIAAASSFQLPADSGMHRRGDSAAQ